MKHLLNWKVQLLSYLFSATVYTWLFNWKVALLLCLAIGFHEHGHLYMAKKLGLETRGFVLIPFVGGMAFISNQFQTFKHQVMIALAGPVAGTLLSCVCYVAYRLTHYDFLGSATLWMLIINAFNLIPLALLDGGQVMEAIFGSIHPTARLWYVGLSTVIAVVLLCWMGNPLVAALIVFFSGQHFLKQLNTWKIRKAGLGWALAPSPAPMTGYDTFISAVWYVFVLSGIISLISLVNTPTVGLQVLFQS